ncbi:hypothetical protein CLV47_11829 [Antricoccus suffuscus]|uniref:Uncharacterized protein n=1 Tax=Antricoccus suffuscus TaxID=1629062 RepID=A0A2T0ZTK7_9ACTN|nr:hypothetical protein CLV47_11829 [Antricoccus suffuscus]
MSSATASHLLTDERIDQIFTEQFGVIRPRVPEIPATSSLDELEAIANLIDSVDDIEAERHQLAHDLYTDLPMVDPQPTHADGYGYLSGQQWLAHARSQITSRPEILAARRVSPQAAIATAITLAALARKNGVFMAGLDNAAAKAPRISERTFYRALGALQDLGIAARRFQGRRATYEERALILAVGLKHDRWRSIWQLTMPRKPIRPTSWQSPRSESFKASTSRYRGLSTRLPRDEAATPQQPRRKPRWKHYDPAARTLFDGLQKLSRTWNRATPGRMLPKLTKFALAGVGPSQLIAAMDRDNAQARRVTPRWIRDPNRWLLAALGRLDTNHPPT